MFTNDHARPWERGSFTNSSRFHAFVHVRDLPEPERSIRRGYNDHRIKCLGKSGAREACGRWELWSVEDQWVARLDVWDAELDRQKRAAFFAEGKRASERHARLLAGAQQVLAVPVRAVLDALSDPNALPSLRALATSGGPGLRAAVADARQAIALMPAIVVAERLVLGLTTESLDVRENPPTDPVASAIASDPRATALAMALLDHIAGRT